MLSRSGRGPRASDRIRAGQRWKAMDANARSRWDELAKGAKEDYDEAVRLFATLARCTRRTSSCMHDVTRHFVDVTRI